MNRIVGATVLTLLLSGCGPIYTTTYEFEHPQYKPGSRQYDSFTHCISKAASSRERCRAACQSTNTQCFATAQQDMYDQRRDCYRHHRGYYDKHGHWHKDKHSVKQCDYIYADTSACSQDCGQCDQDYREAYRICGGTVTEQVTCVDFCDQEQQGNVGN